MLLPTYNITPIVLIDMYIIELHNTYLYSFRRPTGDTLCRCDEQDFGVCHFRF